MWCPEVVVEYILGQAALTGTGVMPTAAPVRSHGFNRWLHRISRILAVLDYEGVKQATPEVLRPKRKSSAHSL